MQATRCQVAHETSCASRRFLCLEARPKSAIRPTTQSSTYAYHLSWTPSMQIWQVRARLAVAMSGTRAHSKPLLFTRFL